jgi:hypothetical protein
MVDTQSRSRVSSRSESIDLKPTRRRSERPHLHEYQLTVFEYLCPCLHEFRPFVEFQRSRVGRIDIDLSRDRPQLQVFRPRFKMRVERMASQC